MKTHGLNSRKNRHPLYGAWSNMKTRCFNSKASNYKYYGARGITVCDRWLTFENFHQDMFATWGEGLQLDRIDVNGNYEPANCRWISASKNSKNRRNKAVTQSKYPGVSWSKSHQKWTVQINFGYFESEEEAYQTYLHKKTP